MTQRFQDVRKDLSVMKPNWMGDAVFKEMKEHWESPQFKLKSEQNKKNRDANAGASAHTDGCILHRVIWKRLKKTTGKDPSFSEFYFRTHRKEKDKSWVNEKAEAAYNKFEKNKEELLASQSASVDGETNSVSELSQLGEMDIWVLSVGGKKKGKVAGLGSVDEYD
ncbi:uncharacterized protein LOC107793658 [Nicotiana tabacum]|uniref:Uncharacterized protein LOC107793658 n=1 Tax=Nicotiana tabacum TaxID=4097 RepID=A0A1S4A4H1_TOBAC|nr:PREDICTED: uncharacterized protein LOC107793658 [Nicotiana tabacum]